MKRGFNYILTELYYSHRTNGNYRNVLYDSNNQVFSLIYYQLREFWGVVRELLIESRSVTAHNKPGNRGLVEETQASLENRN